MEMKIKDLGYDLCVIAPDDLPKITVLVNISHHKTAHDAKKRIEKKKWNPDVVKILRCSNGKEVPFDCIGAGESFSTK